MIAFLLVALLALALAVLPKTQSAVAASDAQQSVGARDTLAIWAVARPVLTHPLVRAYSYYSPVADVAAWVPTLATKAEAIRAFTAFQDTLPALQLYLYPTVEDKGMRTRRMDQVHTDSAGIHLVSRGGFRGEQWGEQYETWLRTAWGAPRQAALLHGLRFQWVDSVAGQPWRTWVHALAQADALPVASELLASPDLNGEGHLIGLLAAAAWVDYRLATLGKAALQHAYVAGDTARPDDHLAWRNWILSQYPTHRPRRSNAAANTYQKGFTLAHEGYRIYNGYGSERARQSILKLQQLGVNALAIVPYSYMPDPNVPSAFPLMREAGTENDEAVLFAHFAAQASGQMTLMKPQIWLGRGSWPGDVDFEEQRDWDAFFRYYKRWIAHYALLSEMYGFDALCIGTELRYTTLKQPAQWQALISDLRRIYGGTLTYAANWGEEAEKMVFWSDLDVIGVNCYYPLHHSPDATEAELAAGATRIMDKLERIAQAADRPMWFTEVGFRSAASPWVSPHAEAGDRPIDTLAQAKCYELLLSAVAERPWLRGLFWWKWPSDMSHNESKGRGYMPLGKPTERVLAKAYKADL
jgi:hypothetical protein